MNWQFWLQKGSDLGKWFNGMDPVQGDANNSRLVIAACATELGARGPGSTNFVSNRIRFQTHSPSVPRTSRLPPYGHFLFDPANDDDHRRSIPCAPRLGVDFPFSSNHPCVTHVTMTVDAEWKATFITTLVVSRGADRWGLVVCREGARAVQIR